MSKPTVICRSSTEMDPESKERFIESMSNNGEYEVIFDESGMISWMINLIVDINPREIDKSVWQGGEWISRSLNQN